jgi:hypothetical protein
MGLGLIGSDGAGFDWVRWGAPDEVGSDGAGFD